MTMQPVKQYKEYTYIRNGKPIIVKRSYTIEGVNQLKKQELDEWFNNNPNIDTRLPIKTLFNDYNDAHNLKISYTTFQRCYNKHIGKKYHKRS